MYTPVIADVDIYNYVCVSISLSLYIYIYIRVHDNMHVCIYRIMSDGLTIFDVFHVHHLGSVVMRGPMDVGALYDAAYIYIYIYLHICIYIYI